jgi:hypothetical protein
VRQLTSLLALAAALAWADASHAQSKEDLLSGAPLNPEIVYNAMQAPQTSNALAQCGAGKLSSGTATFFVSVSPSGAATLTKTDPVLPPDVSGCLGGVIASMSLPKSGGGVDVTFLFTFPAVPPPAIGAPAKPEYPPEWWRGRRIKKAGLGLAIPGWIITGLGALVMFAYISVDPSDRDQVLRVSLGMMGVGLMLAIPGTVLISIGNRKMRQALGQGALPLPALAYDPSNESAHLTLSWRF